MYTSNNLRNDKFGYVMEGAIDDKRFAGNFDMKFPFNGPIADRLKMGDVCWYKPGMLNKIGKEGKTSWDSFSYFLMMAHNVYMHIDSVQNANALPDVATARYTPSHKHWQKVKAGKKIDEFDTWIPRNVIYVVNFINELFKSETPMQMLDEAQPMLADFSGQKSIKTSASAFDSLFEASWGDQGDDDFTEDDAEAAESFLESLET